ncbi:hydroxymethylglutaryl-CoA lyase [Ponticoccus alexandrii]|uniref:Hydroxymethylglutaryl-CoA lyase n=1 Tax=Ponticoccus alexandrii TaxID=1943633 RepID=A0ABX7FGK2_9RHOB|nr:hydroxymethylglutaryl-CoA lyase [Ponticoccus alexandrii]KID12342.1 hydroxymethylglutaryl-CoA lyase [Rhodobacteraceae bacterium PD-2]QRF69191.1 hydroxymethylglutaryl-CoA lyase [Ponticoccus alexandrii]
MTAKPEQVEINEVVLRDGLQNEAEFVATEEKIRLADRLSRTGIKRLEVTSFVSPKAIPNLRDAAEVLAGLQRVPGVRYTALVPNVRGAERALHSKVDEVNLVMSIGEQHNLANMRMTCAESLAQFTEIMRVMEGSGVFVNGTLATTFGCPFEGRQSMDRILWGIEEYLALGIEGITIADTIGVANPRHVAEVVATILDRHPGLPLTLHLHNTRDMGLVNALAAYDAGIRSFDSALGGIGGCPYAPGATGNVCTEDLVHMFHQCGIQTGTDLGSLIGISQALPDVLSHAVPGFVMKAGTSDRLYPFPGKQA